MRPIALALAALLTLVSAAHAEPDFFTDQPYAEALAAAAEQGKLLFVKGTAVWCEPCHRMDRTTFADSRVRAWLTENAVSVAVDVDDQEDLARELKIGAMPTVIVFHGEQELGRVIGYREAPTLLEWLQELKNVAPGDAGRNDFGGRPDPWLAKSKRENAIRLWREGDLEGATQECLWLLNNAELIHVSALPMFEELATLHAPARELFTVLRDRLSGSLAEDAITQRERGIWLQLNTVVLKDPQPVVAWAEVLAASGKISPVRDMQWSMISRAVGEAERWDLLGTLVPAPLAEVERAVFIKRFVQEHVDEADGKITAETVSDVVNEFRREMSGLHAGLLHAGRDDEAWSVLAWVLPADDTLEMRCAIVERCIELGVPRASHREVIGRRAGYGPEVRELRIRLDKEIGRTLSVP